MRMKRPGSMAMTWELTGRERLEDRKVQRMVSSFPAGQLG